LDDFKKHLKQKVAKKSARCEATYKRALVSCWRNLVRFS